MDEKLAYKWARQALKPVEKADILEPHKYQQIADKIVAAIFNAYKLGHNKNIMTEEQKYKLQKAIYLIEDALNNKDTNLKFLAIGLSVAGDYCKEIAKETGNNESND